MYIQLTYILPHTWCTCIYECVHVKTMGESYVSFSMVFLLYFLRQCLSLKLEVCKRLD